MKPDKNQIESSLRLHVDRLAGLIGPRYLQKPKTIQATIGYIGGIPGTVPAFLATF
jgi:hypothetical protein